MTIDEKLSALRDIIQFDIGERGLARDPERNLINAFPDDFANACRSLAAHSSPSVAIVTGFWIADAEPPCGETDGPLGAVFLARAFQTIGIPSVVVTDFFCEQSLKAGFAAACPAAKVDVLTIPPAMQPRDVILELDWTSTVLRRKLTHMIAIERVGPARDDRCYSMRGRDISSNTCPAHLLIEDAARRYPIITTIGIGDGGNEIGMGKIPVEIIERNIPNGRQIACRVPTDHLIVAGISNWGAYALAAGVALIRGQRLDSSLFDPDCERWILERMVADGPLVDGKTTRRTATVDGVSFDEYVLPLVRIGEIVESSYNTHSLGQNSGEV